MITKIVVKRVYDDPSGSNVEDGFRVYADRLWPRGESKDKFHYDLWAKDLAPSTELREWFHADPTGRWSEFVEKYTAELQSNPAMPEFLKTISQHPLVTLLYSSRDADHNNEQVLASYLRSHLK